MKVQLTLLVLTFSLALVAQETFHIDLANVNINPSVRFKVNRVIDGRRNKIDIGWVQPGGFATKMKIAVLDGSLDQVMQAILMRSSLMSSDRQGWVMRVTRLAIGEGRPKSDITKTIRAEVAFDIFQTWNLDSCYYVGSAIGRSELSAVSASNKHVENIGLALEDAIQRVVIKKPTDSSTRFAFKDLEMEDFTHRDVENVPIMNTDQHPDGIFLSFEEFLENKPSVTSNYDIKIGSTVKLWRLDNGKKERVTGGVYGLARNNELYILFNENFYPLQRRSGSFHFFGPPQSDPSSFGRNAVGFGVMGASAAATAKNLKTHYRIDLDNGGFVEMGMVR